MIQATKKLRRRVNGVLLLDKPGGMSSNAALQKARWLFNAAKAGHTGTLDPMATGLLPLCFGEATKFASGLLGADKCYEASIGLGVRTDTGDAEGVILEQRPVAVSAEDIAAALLRFTGDILQVPPMYSALKRDGKPLYEYARQGVELERQARPVTIHSLTLVDYAHSVLRVVVGCSKGTYIRTLAEDIGAALGCGAHLTALRRTRIGSLSLKDAITLEALEALSPAARDAALQPMDGLLPDLPQIMLDAEAARRFGHGQSVAVSEAGTAALEGSVKVYADNQFLGLGRRLADGCVAPERVVVAEAPGAD